MVLTERLPGAQAAHSTVPVLGLMWPGRQAMHFSCPASPHQVEAAGSERLLPLNNSHVLFRHALHSQNFAALTLQVLVGARLAQLECHLPHLVNICTSGSILASLLLACGSCSSLGSASLVHVSQYLLCLGRWAEAQQQRTVQHTLPQQAMPLTFSDSISACLAVQALSSALVGVDCADLALLAGRRPCSSKPSASIQHAVACTPLAASGQH